MYTLCSILFILANFPRSLNISANDIRANCHFLQFCTDDEDYHDDAGDAGDDDDDVDENDDSDNASADDPDQCDSWTGQAGPPHPWESWGSGLQEGGRSDQVTQSQQSNPP